MEQSPGLLRVARDRMRVRQLSYQSGRCSSC